MDTITCNRCGYRASAEWVAAADYCPECKAAPFVGYERGRVDFGVYSVAVEISDEHRAALSAGLGQFPLVSEPIAYWAAFAAGHPPLFPGDVFPAIDGDELAVQFGGALARTSIVGETSIWAKASQ